jgi:CheY-like chemotaxis protein
MDSIGSSLEGLVVLAVEDDPDSLEVLSQMLELEGAHVLACLGVEEAIATWQREQPDVLATDLSLGGDVDGVALLRRIRAISPDAPAIVVTGYADAAHRQHTLSAGFNAFVSKPIDAAEIATLVLTLTRPPASEPPPTSPRLAAAKSTPRVRRSSAALSGIARARSAGTRVATSGPRKEVPWRPQANRRM